MKKALAGVTGNIKVTADMDPKKADAAIAALKLRMEALSQTLAKMRASVDTKSAEASIVGLQTQLHGLAKNVSSITFNADTSKLDAAIAKEKALLLKLQRQASELQIDADATRADQKITDLKAEAFHLDKRLNSLNANVDIDKALNRLYAIEAEIAVLDSSATKIEFAAKTVAINAQIEAVRAHIQSLSQEKIDLAANVDVKSLLGAEHTMLRLEAATGKMADTTVRATKAGGAFQGIWTGGWLRGAVLGIGIWHIALDGLLEAVIIVTASAAALAAGVAALGESARNLATHMKGVLTVSSALGVDVPPLTGKFDDLATAMAPRAVEAFGGALELIKTQAGGVLSRMEPVVSLFDTWIAKIDIWAAHERDFGTVINAGREFLEQLGKAVGILVDAIANLLQKDPGIAHFLLDFVQGALLLLDAFSKLPAPVVEATLAIHGAYLWLKLLVAVPILKFAASLGILSAAQLEAAGSALKFQNIVKFLVLNPFGWATVAAVAIGYLGYQLTQATGAARSFNAALEKGLSSDTASQAITQISSDIGLLNQQIDRVPARVGNLDLSVVSFAAKAGASFKQVSYDINKGDISGALNDIGRTAYNAVRAFLGFQSVGPQIKQTQNDVGAFRGEIVKLTAEQTRLFHTTGMLVKGHNDLHIGTVSVSQAFALMDLAGVKASDSFAVQWQKVKNLVTGYETLSIRGGILKNSVNAVTFAALQQQERVAQLNTAWDAFFNTVSGGETGFLSFAQQTIGLFRVLGSSSVKMSESNGKVSTSMRGLEKASKGATVSMTGLNDVSINARETFLKSAEAANTQIDNLTLLANAAGLGDKGTRLLTRSTQDMVAALLPATGRSKALTDVLYVLAQRGGYQGANSFKALSHTLTTDASNLEEDVKNLSIALGQNLNDAMASAILQATGGQKAFDDFASAMLHTKTNSKAQQAAAVELGNQLLSLTGNTKDAHAEFDTFAQQMKISRVIADELWNEIAGKLTPGINNLTVKAIPGAKHAFVDWADHGLVNSKNKANDLWGQLTGKLGPQLDKLGDLTVPKAKNKFIDWAEHSLKLTQNQAKALWAELVTLQSHIDKLHGKTVQIHMNGQGLYTITGSIIAASQGKGGSGNAAGGLAAGGFISGGTPGKDSVAAMLMPGEVVVPTGLVQAGAVDHLRGRLPGFASGGQVGTPAQHLAAGGVVRGSTDNLSGTFVDGMYTTFQSAMTKTMVGVMRSSIKAARAAAEAAAAAFAVSGAGPVGGDQAVNKALARSMFPWPAFMWPSYDYLEMREAGYNRFARNPSSGAYGIPQALPPTKMPFAAQAAGGSHAGPQLSWMYGYISSVYANPVNAAAHERRMNWYAKGGLVPGYAGGGVAALQARLRTLEHREGVDYLGLRHAFWSGPRKYLNKITRDELETLRKRQAASQAVFSLLNRSPANVSDVNLRKLRSVTLAEKRTAADKWLNRTPGGHPGWASGLRYWLSQLAALGATSKGGPAGTAGLSSVLPPVKHVYGGDVGDVIGAYLAANLSPLGAAGGGLVMDRGGYLKPGWNPPMYNGTGRPEPVGAVPVTINIEIGSTGNATFDQMMLAWIKKTVKVNGGGDTQDAFGASNIRFVRR